ncbi:hypothetical protein [Haloarcula sp. H-GB5]
MNECPTCSEEYERLGQHFAHNDHRPALTEYERSIIEYLVLRGAQVRENASRPSLAVFGTDKKCLTDIADSLGYLANDVRIHEDSTTAAQRLQEQHGSKNIQFDADSIEDVWTFTTVPHEGFSDYEGGASELERLHPRSLSLLALHIGDVEQYSIFPTLHFDTRNCDVSATHFRTLLHREGIKTLPADATKHDNVAGRLNHYHDGVVSVPHPASMELLDSLDLELEDVADGPMQFG